MTTSEETPRSKITLSLFTLVHALFLFIGSGGSLLLRVYFTHGCHRLWLSSLVQIVAWLLLLLPLSFTSRRLHLSLSLYLIFSFLGVLFALDCYIHSLASAFLPLSTSSLLISSQLAFTAFFAFLIVRQRFTPFSFNAVVLLTLGPVVLSLGARSDQPEGESNGKYILGFIMAIAAAALAGFIFALMELTMRWGKVVQTYAAAMEMQLVIGIAGTAFCLVGMAINKDFQVIPREAREFGLGKMKYFMVLFWDAVFWQLVNIGLVGLVSGASSLFVAMMFALQLPLLEVLTVVFLHEKFNGAKGISLLLSLWGFVSYLYGEKKQTDKAKETAQLELAAVA